MTGDVSPAALSPRSRPTSSPGLSRRHSVQERLDGILENARERAESIRVSGRSPIMSTRSRPEGGHARPQHDVSADETTGIVTCGPERNYQTMNMNEASSSAGSPRPRPSALRNRASESPSTSQHGQQVARPAQPAANGSARGAAADAGRGRGRWRWWWKGVLENFASVELENKGSVARDHLALERTFLAWLRTSLAFASIGIAITQLFRLNTSLNDGREDAAYRTLRRLGKPLGATFLAISILMLFLGYHRYFQAQQWIMRGKFPASRGTIILVSFVAFALMVAALVVVVAVHPAETAAH